MLSSPRELAALGDVFVSDGFGVVHREQASVTDIARLLPNAAGRLVQRESEVFSRLLGDPARPYVVVLGGSKVSDKLAVIGNLIPRVDRLLIGGGMAFTFLAAQGYSVGSSLLEEDQIPVVEGFLEQAERRGIEVALPVDVVVADRFAEDAAGYGSCLPWRFPMAGWAWISDRQRRSATPSASRPPARSCGTAPWGSSR